MKIMLVGSIRKKQSVVDSFIVKIIDVLESKGHTVIHEHFTKTTQDELDKMSESEDSKFHSKILRGIKSSDIVISECSEQSLSVGYLLSYAADLGRPVIIFYSSDSKEPNLFSSLTKSSKFFLVKYTSISDIGNLTIEYIDYAKDQADVRFNFFISPTIGTYLDWVSKVKKIPRSVFLRGLIEKDMADNDEYNS